MSAITGLRDTENREQRKYDVEDVISLLDVNRYPLLAILTNAGKDPVSNKGKAFKKEATSDPEFKWEEDDFQAREDDIKSSQDPIDISSESTFDVENVDRFSVGDVVYLPGKKYTFKVTGIGGDELTVTEELGGEAGESENVSSEKVWIVGNANEEGATLRTIKSTTPTEKVGYCQIFRTPFGVTETSKATQTLIKENDIDYQRRKKGIEHAVDIERAFLFGKKYKVTSGSHPERGTQGVLNNISTYATANVDTEADFEAFLEDAFANGNTEKYAFVSATFVTQINQWAHGKVQMVNTDQTYGITIMKYQSAHGTLNLIKHDLLKGTPYGNYCVVVDMENLTYKYLEGRDTKLLTNRQANDEDALKEEFLTECGLQMKHESTHAVCSKSAL
jgi:hypothetical protein